MATLMALIRDALRRWWWVREERRMVSVFRALQESRQVDRAVARWLREHFTDQEAVIIADRLEGE